MQYIFLSVPMKRNLCKVCVQYVKKEKMFRLTMDYFWYSALTKLCKERLRSKDPVQLSDADSYYSGLLLFLRNTLVFLSLFSHVFTMQMIK